MSGRLGGVDDVSASEDARLVLQKLNEHVQFIGVYHTLLNFKASDALAVVPVRGRSKD
jgi:hypothetical protein